MLTRTTMTALLVVTFLAGWCRGQDYESAGQDRTRRAYLKRRSMEDLTARGRQSNSQQTFNKKTLSDFLSLTSNRDVQHQSNRNTHLLEAWNQGDKTDNLLEFSPLTSDSHETWKRVPFHQFLESSSLSFDNDYDELIAAYMSKVDPIQRQHVRREVAQVQQNTKRDRTKKNQRDEFKKQGRRRRDQKKKNRDEKKKNGRIKNRWIEESSEITDCCPSKLLVVLKEVGKAPQHHALDIHPNHNLFYERVCDDHYLNKECSFPNKTLRKKAISRCIQQTSFSQALTKRYNTTEDWKLDYIKVKSGCSCQVLPPKRKKKKRKR